MRYTSIVLRIIFSSLKYRIRYKLPVKIYSTLANIAAAKRESNFREQSKVYGELHPSEYFLVIRKRPPGWGFFSNIFYVLQGLKYSEELGYIPVVDMENYFMSELSSLRPINGTRNAWNYFFENVSEYNLSEVYRSKNVILSDGNRISQSTSWLRNRDTELLKNTEKMVIVGDLINKYIRLNKQTGAYLEKLKADLSWSGEETLGIFVRGSVYYNSIQFPKNTIINFDILVKEIKDFLEKKSFKQIYICTEDFRVYLKLYEIFKNFNILTSIRFEPSLTVKEWINTQNITNIGGNLNMGFHNTRTYLAEILLLSECANFVGTFSNATTFALAKGLRNGGNKRLILANKVYNF
jgi:hypothetical protein